MRNSAPASRVPWTLSRTASRRPRAPCRRQLSTSLLPHASTSSFEQLKETLFSAGYGAYVVAGGVVGKAEELDGRYGVVNTVSGVVGAVAEKVSDLDRALGVSATAMKVDEKVTGGIGTDLVNKGVVLVNNSVEYVTGALQQAKMAANEESKEKAPKTVEDATEVSKPSPKDA
ncbi:hypothetical protein F442_16136 [Phytophthora nicotianae P10297]|uniref:Senescence domain-containing protein n=1 Tax=Phytophthora nicotianae P10297 TaxID=1317064 RepID=W2YLL8_PHYNI|nr:hypothetical protein F442_16136 [Phytophthora nicotianae P10297]